MLLQHSRRDARITADGELVTLEEQDRNLWDRDAISEGLSLVESALRQRAVGYYQLQAAIAALHAEAPGPDLTDWPQIVALYDELLRVSPAPIIALNRAVAVAMSRNVEEGLALVAGIERSNELKDYYVLHAAKADLLRRSERFEEALLSYEQALEITPNKVTQKYLQRRMNEVKKFLVTGTPSAKE